MSETSNRSFSSISVTNLNGTEINLTLLLTMSLPSLLICLLGLVGNGIVLRFLCFAIERNSFTIYILNLAVADFSLLLSTIVVLLYFLITVTVRTVPSSNEAILFAMKLTCSSVFNTSLLLLTAISVERCISVFHPIWYKCHRPAYQSTISCVFIWIISIFIALLECVMCRDVDHSGIDPHCTAFMVFVSSFGFGIILPLIIMSNLLLIFKLTSHSKRRQPMQLYRAISINVLVFMVTAFLPNLLSILLFFEIIIFNTLNSVTIFYVIICLATINCSANPYIYFLVGKTKKEKFSGSIKAILQRVFRNDHDSQCSEDTLNSRATTAGDLF